MTCVHLLLTLVFAVSLGTPVEIQGPRGVPLTKKQFYVENKPFTCLDGSRTIPFDRVNDDYCDCKDGSDEPGTAACPNGSFHCTNAGYRTMFIPSSRINDGICDCCDTTDEYNSGAKCENTCKELGRKEREVLQKMTEITKEGFLLKQHLIEEAKKGHQEKQIKVTDMQENKKQLDEKVEVLRTVKETAEQPEKEAKERHLKAWEEQKAAIRLEKDKAKMAEAFLELDDNADGFVSVSELQSHAELDADADGTLTETEAQGLMGGAEQVDMSTFESVWPNIKDKYHSEVSREEADMSCLVSSEVPFGPHRWLVQLPSEAFYRYVTEKYSCTSYVSSSCSLFPYANPTVLWFTAAQKARDDFEEAEKALREMDDQIRNIEKELSFDFGPDAEFTYLYSQCYELTTGEYIYRLCPFNRVSQKPKYGGSETNLGTWGSWSGPENNKYLLMKYEHGTGCWQGPNRSTTVKLTCGKETVVTSTSEPSRCEYLMEFTTPAVCQEPANTDLSPHDHVEL
uniref:Glucosidase 2 subunit beta n=1 Tax=Sinocyclocheilus grahami TaxID=75366 RepID=A0A672QMW0_SINGR